MFWKVPGSWDRAETGVPPGYTHSHTEMLRWTHTARTEGDENVVRCRLGTFLCVCRDYFVVPETETLNEISAVENKHPYKYTII